VFDAVFEGLAALLAFFYSIWPSYAGAIILLTLTVMLVLTPLSVKGTRSMLAMSRMAPEMKKLQQQYKDDREKLNEEMLKFYRENKINPVGGCLPLLLQLPVFIVLYQVLLGMGTVEERVVDAQAVPEGIETVACTAADRAGELCAIGPKHLDPGTDLYQSLAATIDEGREGAIQMVSMGMDLSQSLLRVMGEESILAALPFFVMVLIVAGTGWYQSKQIQSRNPNMVTPQQQMITRLMPIFFGMISIGIAGGVVLYFVVSNTVRIGQQYLVTRLEFRTPPETNGADDDAAPAKDPGANDAGANDADAQPEAPSAAPKAAPARQPAKSQPAKRQSSSKKKKKRKRKR
jgi:YidC/Oxa1 family membrane protein insertase